MASPNAEPLPNALSLKVLGSSPYVQLVALPSKQIQLHPETIPSTTHLAALPLERTQNPSGNLRATSCLIGEPWKRLKTIEGGLDGVSLPPREAGERKYNPHLTVLLPIAPPGEEGSKEPLRDQRGREQ